MKQLILAVVALFVVVIAGTAFYFHTQHQAQPLAQPELQQASEPQQPNRPQAAAPEPMTPEKSCEQQAEKLAEDALLPNLKAPSTAKFSSVYGSVVSGECFILGHVDSQNSYGAMLRASFYGYYIPDNGKWVLRRIDFHDNNGEVTNYYGPAGKAEEQAQQAREEATRTMTHCTELKIIVLSTTVYAHTNREIIKSKIARAFDACLKGDRHPLRNLIGEIK